MQKMESAKAQRPIEAKTSEELALMLEFCNQQIEIHRSNKQIILQELNARNQRRLNAEKELDNEPDAGKGK